MLNQAQIIGHLGKDPESRFMPNGEAVCNFSVATTERWKDKSGEKQEDTQWHRITTFRKLAEICGEYLHKGSLVYIRGKIQTREYTDKDGIKRYSTEIVADEMKMLGGKPDAGERQESAPKPEPRRSQNPVAALDDDIPFDRIRGAAAFII